MTERESPERTAPIWASDPEGRVFRRLPVTTMLNGAELTLPLHVLTGRTPGPTLGIVTNQHGDEFLPTMVIRQWLAALDTTKLAGRIAVVSVANPLATAACQRLTPEPHGRTDLHEAFPGNARGNTTQMMAAVITAQLLDHLDFHCDFHAGGTGGRLQGRVDYHGKAPPALRDRCLAMARAFGQPFVHENDLTGTSAHYVTMTRGIPSCNPEVGGTFLGPDSTATYIAQSLDGLTRLAVHLGLVDAPLPSMSTLAQIHFGLAGRRELRPRNSGYLESCFERPADIGKLITRGTLLGKVIDLYSYEVLEEIVAPCDGYLFFSRYSGTVSAGTQAFALAEQAKSQRG
ncbi:MAG: succinylglutamate desuccinylase/aspartoacylase family protein [Proteobacteria bacterium]|nr:succinylglutamate desuccinylase/aspartoacylase family protein [Burkholderiales bacterium]